MKRITALILCIVFLLLTGCSGSSEKMNVKLCFLDSEKTGVVYEEREISYTKDEEIPSLVMDEFLKGPENSELRTIVPEGLRVNEVITNNNLIVVDFSSEFVQENNADNLLLRTCVVNTLTAVAGIDNVLILVNGDNLTDVNGDVIGIIKKGDIVSDQELTQETDALITLYFSESDYAALISETREVTISQNETTEMKIMKELLKGPEKKNLQRTIPAETKILSVETKDGVCFVNLSQDFISKNSGGISAQTLSVYSIVNSLTELEMVDKVQFLIEGQKVESFIDMIFNEPFVRDEGLIRN
ncbi:MAG: GerMN domain-containing protein [Clostridia bacterium]|nr:GerMN domain-containing protein [Clostridia bacterium]